jgi:arsenate reductase
MPGVKIVDWSLPDPKGQPLETVRQIRDDIHERVRDLMKDHCRECANTPV